MKAPAPWRWLARWGMHPDRREDVDADLCEELELRAAETSPGAARRWYRRQAVGFAIERLRPRPRYVPIDAEPSRRMGMRETLRHWTRDLRHAARALRRTPGFALAVVGILALAIGAVTAMFSVVHKVLIDPLPYAHADRLVHVAASAPGSDLPPEFGVSAEFYLHYRERSRLLEDVAVYNSYTSTLRVGDRAERVRMSSPTNSIYATLGAHPALGRLPAPEDDNRVAVISDALWTTWFNRDPDALGQTHYMAGSNRTIIGIMGPEFRFPDDGTLLWLSGEIRAEGLTPGRFGLPLVARMSPGATPDMVADELNRLARQLPDRFGGSAAYVRLITQQHRAVVRPLKEEMFAEVSQALWILLSAVGIVLLIACANVANLFTVRAEGRQRDLAVRRAIGAARGQLIRLQMAEAIVVAALAGALAVGFALLALPAFLAFVPPGVPRLQDVAFTAPVLAFTLAVAAFTALACGAVPAYRASRPDFTRLREGGRGATRRRHWARDGLVVGQTALALVLLIGSGLLLRSFAALRQVDPGYETADIFTFQIAPENPALTDGPSYARFDLEFMDRLRALPGVEIVGLVENLPLNEGTSSGPFVPDRLAGQTDRGPLLQVTFTAGDYFEAMGISLLGGRTFETADHVSPLPNVIVSESAAALLFPGDNAVGRRVQRQGTSEWYTVVGVVEDVMQGSFRDTPDPLLYYPLAGPTPTSWVISSPAYVLKTPRAESIAADVRALVREIAPGAPMYRVFTMAQLARDSMVGLSFMMLTLAVVSGLALLLGAVGLYAVLSYVVAARRREIGVRLALGARAAQVRRMVVVQGLRVVAAGVAIGIGVALVSTRALEMLLFGIEPVDAATFAAMSLGMIAIGLLASYLPARRASAVDPVESMRGE